jgi:glycosyltransferase involved in cell wall biosynthesis
MKILHLLYESKGDYFGMGGVAVRAYEIYSRLKDRHEITLLCRNYPHAPAANEGYINGLRHIYVGMGGTNFTVALLSYAYEASRFVRRYGEGYDVIVEDFSPAVPTSLCLYNRRPVVLQIQGYTGSMYFRKYNPLKAGVLYLLERALPSLYRHVIAVSETSLRRYRVSKGALKAVIPNGIDDRLLKIPTGNEAYILYLGRIDVHHKGIDVLLEAYRRLCLNYSIPLLIAGDFRDKGKFYDIYNRLPERVRGLIRLTGWVDSHQKYELLQDALMVVMPSRYETQGIVALEAMASARPLVVSDIPELGYVVEQGAGISFSPADAGALCEAMEAMIQGSERRAMGERGRAWVKSFTWDEIALQFEAHLQRTLA